MVLDAAEEEMAEGRIIARTATFALFRSPVTLLDPGPAGRHSKANIHYAMCVNRTTGKLEVIVWTVKSDAGSQQVPATVVRMKPAAVFPVRARRAGETDSGNRAVFLVVCHARPSPGSKLRVPPALGVRMVEASRHPANSDPDELELLLQKIIPTAPAADIAGDKTVVPGLRSSGRRTATPPPYRWRETRGPRSRDFAGSLEMRPVRCIAAGGPP